MINVILADDHEVVIEGLKAILLNDPAIQVVGQAVNGKEVLDLLEQGLEVDIAILDVEMQPMNGIETAMCIKQDYPQTKVLILTMYDEKQYIMELMKIGVAGYILKNKCKEQLRHALHQIKSGNAHFGLDVLNKLSKTDRTDTPVEEIAVLTRREKDVLSLIGEGKTTKEISSDLKIDETTVNTHKRNLRHKLEVSNEKHLVRYAIKYGYASV